LSGYGSIASQSIDADHHYYPGCISTDNSGNYSIKVLVGTWAVTVPQRGTQCPRVRGRRRADVTISGGVATANFVATPLPSSISAPGFGRQ